MLRRIDDELDKVKRSNQVPVEIQVGSTLYDALKRIGVHDGGVYAAPIVSEFEEIKPMGSSSTFDGTYANYPVRLMEFEEPDFLRIRVAS